MKSTKIASISVNENDSILNNTYDYVSEKGIKITLNGKSDIITLYIPEELKSSNELEETLIQAVNHANVIVREMIQNTLIKELLKQDPQLFKELKIKDIQIGEEKKS